MLDGEPIFLAKRARDMERGDDSDEMEEADPRTEEEKRDDAVRFRVFLILTGKFWIMYI